ncbi:MAG: metallopeptidase TldD-related protein [Elusimicrobiales bacterium]
MKPALLALLAVLPVRAAEFPAGDKCMSAMKDEMARTLSSLRMDDFPGPYFVSYALHMERGCEITASLGSLVRSRDVMQMRGQAEVRAGSPEFDNSNFYGSSDEMGPAGFLSSLDCNYGNTRHNLWQLTDLNYKTALEKLDQKRAFREKRNIADPLPDLTPAPGILLSEPEAPAAGGRAELEKLARTVSAEFRKYPALDKTMVNIARDNGLRRYLNSEGAFYRSAAANDVSVEFTAQVQSADGFKIAQRMSFYYDAASLPGADFFRARAGNFAAETAALAGSATAAPYIGPVLFEGEAAGELFKETLAHSLIRPRAWWTERERDPEAGAFSGKLGMRVAAPSINVTDDPSLREWNGQLLAGHYLADDEGVPAQRVELIKKGKLADLLLSRAPVRERAASNGHGRSRYSWAEAVPGNLIVSVSSCAPAGGMKARLLEMCRELELDYGVILRRVDDLRGVFCAYRVYVKDGREEPVHGFQLAELSPRALRDIVLASDTAGAYDYNYKGVPYSIVAPSVIVQEVELKKTEIKPDKPHYLPNPLFQAR